MYTWNKGGALYLAKELNRLYPSIRVTKAQLQRDGGITIEYVEDVTEPTYPTNRDDIQGSIESIGKYLLDELQKKLEEKES